MKKKRIGNTLVFRFELKTNGEAVTLDGRDIKVLLRDPRGVTSSLTFRVADGNVIFARFEGKDQKVVGKYSIEVWENKGKTDQAVLDFCAIELVNRSKDEKGNCCDKDFNVEEEVDLGMLDFAVGVQGNGIKSITKQESSESGGVNVYTITLDDGKSVVLNIRNGDKGDPLKFDELTDLQKEQLRGKTGLRGPLVYSAFDEPKRNEDDDGSMHEWYFEDIHYSGDNDVDYGEAWIAPVDGHDFVMWGTKLYRLLEMDMSVMPYRYYVRMEADLKGGKGDQGEPGFSEEEKSAIIGELNAAKETANNSAAAAYSAAVRAEGAADEVEDNITLNTVKVQTAVQASAEANSAANDAVFRAQGAVSTANSAALVAQQAKVIAEGRATGYVFNTLSDMKAWLAVAENKAKLILGDNLYIREVNEPDYWWDGESIQKLETEHPDLSGYVKNTDFATTSIAGVVKLGSGNFGISINSNGVLFISRAVNSDITSKTDVYKPITCRQIDMAVKVGLTTNTIALTDIEKANAKKWLGLAPMSMDEYEALVDKSGINFVIPEDYDNQ